MRHVHTEHGSDFVRGVSLPIAVASRLIDLTAGRRVLRRASLVLAVSEGVQRFVERLAGVASRLFPNAIDTAEWLAGRCGADRSGARRLVYLGRLVILDPTNPLVAVPAGLAGVLIGPFFYFAVGLELRRR